jgi:hypothetical protein
MNKQIERSISHNEIVTVDYDISLAMDLAAECEGSVETTDRVEYWGTTDEGDEWRVHLRGDRDDRLASEIALLRGGA